MRAGALSLEQLRTDVLGEDPADIPVDENLAYYGLATVRLMALRERWRQEHGVEAAFADLAEKPALEEWVALLGSA